MPPSPAKSANPSAMRRGLRCIPAGVWALGFVSMFMDVSSEMMHSLLPVFLVSVLGASATAVGVLEGVAEAIVSITRIFSGALSDWLGRRKALALAGYGMAALTKPLFPLADSFALVFFARVTDRVGKGVRGAPRDALVADITPLELRGASFGLRQSLDTVGAFLGPLAAIVLMLALRGNIRGVFCIAVAPAFISVALLAFLVHEPTRAAAPHSVRQAPRWSELRRFPARFWRVVAIGAVFTLARFSEAFLVLRASGLGLSAAYIPLVLVVMNVVYAATSYPAGHLSDRADRRRVLALGGAALIASDLTLAAAHGLPALMAGVALWGLHMGFSQGLLSAMVADAAPAERRATGFGLFSLVSGLVLLLASVIAGVLWDRLGAPATFLAGAVFAALAVAGLLVHMRNHPQPVTG